MSIEIRDVRAICTAPEGINLVAVKIETNEPELYGVGCATFAHRYSAVVTVINDYLRPFLIGKDPSNIEDIWQSVMGMSYWRNGPVLNNALSGVDMALWDIKGKMAGMPLYQLFGGKCRAAIPCYTHAEGDSVDVVLERVAALKELGYRKIRVQVGGYGGKNPSMHRPENSPPGAYFDPKSYIRNVLNLMEILHVKYGGELEFCHDTHERLSPIDAVNFAKELEPYHLLFLEDALPPEQSDWFRILRYYKDENGQFQWAPADTRTLDALKKYQDLYQEGILDSEFYSYTRYQGAQKFYVQGTSGLTLEDGHAIMITYIRNGLAEQGLDPDKVLHLAQLVGDDGMYHYREDSNYWGQVMFSPTISQEKFERAMDILDYTCTEEGQNIMNMGFEGIDWKRDENGNYVSLLDPSIQGSATSVLGGKYPSKESSFGGLILPDDFSLVSPNYNHEIQNTVRNFYKLREELSDETTLLPREYEYEFLSSREKSQATMDLGDEYAKLVLKDGDLEDNWNTWVEEKMAVVQPVLDQLNK